MAAALRSESMALACTIFVGLLVAMGLHVFFVEPLWMVPLLERMTPNIVYRVKTKEPLVALSFDDGPNPEFTPQVLELLRRYDAKATFFLIGERAERHPELVLLILAEGNEVGNHWSRDGSVLGQSEKGFIEGLETTERAIEVATPQKKEEEKDLTQRAQREAHRNRGEKAETEGVTGIPNGLRFFRPPGGVAWPSQLQSVKERG